MEKLQTENYNLFAETSLPVLLKNIDVQGLNSTEQEYLDMVRNWNRRNDANEKAVAVFTTWYDSLEAGIWKDEFSTIPQPWDWPDEYTLIEGLLKDTAYKFIDNISTPEKETLQHVVTAAFKKAVPVLAAADKQGKLSWSKFKDSGIQHLLRLAPLSRFHLTTGGGTNVINATEKFHGPSWRMIVQLTDTTEAYGIYPGGQSGNPGSKYYDTFVDNWAAGQYYPLWVMKKEEARDKRVIMKMSFGK
jgi:penicillin amidase